MDNLDLTYVRKQFPALNREFVFMDNAGGSQVLGTVIEKISRYFLNYNVQLGASYKISAQAQEKLALTIAEVAEFINAKSAKEIIAGSSSTMLLRILSLCISKQWQKGDEVIVTNSDHEANVSCWTDLKTMGIVIKTWRVNPETLEFDIRDLENLLSKKTKLVAMVHTSNILGTINPVKKIASVVHNANALFCVDGVAHAPHRKIDVRDIDVDFYVFSTYKVYGPHQAIMYGKYNLLREMEGLNHFFITKEDVPYKFQPGNFNFELTYSLLGVTNYFLMLNDHHFPKQTKVSKKEKYANCFSIIEQHEQKLSSLLLSYLSSKDDIRIIGFSDSNKEKRVPTISFIHNKYRSSEVVSKVDNFNIGIRFGDFYARKIIQDLKLTEKNGVIRVSMVHYNTFDEVNSLINAFDTIF